MESAVPPGISLVTGPLVLGYMLGYLLYGVLMVQLFFYHIHYASDSRVIKATAWMAFILETTLSALTAAAAWNMFGVGWGNIQTLVHVDRTWGAIPIINALLASQVQNFFAWRIWKLTHKLWLAAIISCVSVLGFSFALYYNSRIIMLGIQYDSPFVVGQFVSAWLACGVLCDMLITGSMVKLLVKARAEASIKQTAATLSNIVKFTIETGFITAFWAVVQLVLWVAMEHNSIHYIFFLGLGRLYSNWLLSTLNSRVYVSATRQPFIDISQRQTQSVFWSDLSDGGMSNGTSSTVVPHLGARVHIKTTKEVHSDQEVVVSSSIPTLSTKPNIDTGEDIGLAIFRTSLSQ